MGHSVQATISTAEKPALSDQQRAERLRALASRLRNEDGLDWETLENIEQRSAPEH